MCKFFNIRYFICDCRPRSESKIQSGANFFGGGERYQKSVFQKISFRPLPARQVSWRYAERCSSRSSVTEFENAVSSSVSTCNFPYMRVWYARKTLWQSRTLGKNPATFENHQVTSEHVRWIQRLQPLHKIVSTRAAFVAYSTWIGDLSLPLHLCSWSF